MSICSYCGRDGHVAASCPRRARRVAVSTAESQWIAITKHAKPVVERKTKPKADPKRIAAWLADLELINREMAT